MKNIEEKFRKFEMYQSKMSQKLGNIDLNLKDDEEHNQSIKDSEYKQKLHSDLDIIMGKVNDNIISTNYLNFYSFLLNKQRKKPQKIKIQKESTIVEKGIQTDFKRSSMQKPTMIKLSFKKGELKDNEYAKRILSEKQNVFLSNELTSLKVKLNKIQEKNKILNSIVKKQSNIRNFKFLEKFISSFVEKLAVNWDTITEKIIDEMIEQEVYELNEIELKKVKHEEIKLTTFSDVLKNAPSINVGFNLIFESMHEVGEMISNVKKQEDIIRGKYNLNSWNNLN